MFFRYPGVPPGYALWPCPRPTNTLRFPISRDLFTVLFALLFVLDIQSFDWSLRNAGGSAGIPYIPVRQQFFHFCRNYVFLVPPDAVHPGEAAGDLLLDHVAAECGWSLALL